MLETSLFEKVSGEGQMAAYQYMGFWSPMDTIRDKAYLEEMWNKGEALWKVW